MADRAKANHSPKRALPVDQAKARVVELIAEGYKIGPALQAVGRAEATYFDWRKKDKQFAESCDLAREGRIADLPKDPVPDFPTFCRDWLKQPLFDHQLNMLDVIEGREPRWTHEAMDFLPGYRNRVLINVPPEHAKSTTFCVNYVVWLIHKNPDIRVVIVSQGSQMAEDFLYEIKLKLTDSIYEDMHKRFGPPEGWKDQDQSWKSDRIYVRGKNVDGVQKDPTVQAMGINGQIYGRRADLIIMDDVVTQNNENEFEKQLRKLSREINSRLPSEKEGGGKLVILGTRIGPNDLYRHLIEQENFQGQRVWSYLRMPAVLDYGDGTPANWTTLWPWKWDGESLGRVRVESNWNLIYQQLNQDSEMTFPVHYVEAAVDTHRWAGPLDNRHRPGGMAGLYVMGGLDPATTGHTAMIVTALDPRSGKRWVLDGVNKANMRPQEMREHVKRLTDLYHINEWVIERNAFQRFLTQDPELMDYFQRRGVKRREHFTQDNKYDTDFGIATMAPLFETTAEPGGREGFLWKRTPDNALISLPAPVRNTWVNALVQQLSSWVPNTPKHMKTDLVMALWFTHIACMDMLNKRKVRKTHFSSPFMTPVQRGSQTVVNLRELREAKLAQRLSERTG